MKQLLSAFILYGLAYYVFESFFNWISDVFNPKIELRYKLRLTPTRSSSFWMIPVGSLAGFLIHLYLIIPLKYTNIFSLILLGVIGCAIITSLELASGMLLNVKLKLELWRYDANVKIFGKEIKLNYKNQIDVFHSLGWFFITYLVMMIDKILF